MARRKTLIAGLLVLVIGGVGACTSGSSHAPSQEGSGTVRPVYFYAQTNHVITVSGTTNMTVETCVSLSSKDVITWKSSDPSITLGIVGLNNTSYPTPVCAGAECTSGALSNTAASGTTVSYTISRTSSSNLPPINGRIIIKP